MGKLFDLDQPLWKAMGRLADLLLLNLLWVIGSLGIFTIGASTTALYYTAFKLAQGEEGYVMKNFFRSFRQNFRQATILWLICLTIGAILTFDLWFSTRYRGILGYLFAALCLAALFFFLFTAQYVFPLLARFENTVVQILKNAIYISLHHVLHSFLLLAILLSVQAITILFVPALLVIEMAVTAYLQALILQKIFSGYMPDTPTGPEQNWAA